MVLNYRLKSTRVLEQDLIIYNNENHELLEQDNHWLFEVSVNERRVLFYLDYPYLVRISRKKKKRKSHYHLIRLH